MFAERLQAHRTDHRTSNNALVCADKEGAYFEGKTRRSFLKNTFKASISERQIFTSCAQT